MRSYARARSGSSSGLDSSDGSDGYGGGAHGDDHGGSHAHASARTLVHEDERTPLDTSDRKHGRSSLGMRIAPPSRRPVDEGATGAGSHAELGSFQPSKDTVSDTRSAAAVALAAVCRAMAALATAAAAETDAAQRCETLAVVMDAVAAQAERAREQLVHAVREHEAAALAQGEAEAALRESRGPLARLTEELVEAARQREAGRQRSLATARAHTRTGCSERVRGHKTQRRPPRNAHTPAGGSRFEAAQIPAGTAVHTDARALEQQAAALAAQMVVVQAQAERQARLQAQLDAQGASQAALMSQPEAQARQMVPQLGPGGRTRVGTAEREELAEQVREWHGAPLAAGGASTPPALPQGGTRALLASSSSGGLMHAGTMVTPSTGPLPRVPHTMPDVTAAPAPASQASPMANALAAAARARAERVASGALHASGGGQRPSQC